jgi:hypothetical protein
MLSTGVVTLGQSCNRSTAQIGRNAQQIVKHVSTLTEIFRKLEIRLMTGALLGVRE